MKASDIQPQYMLTIDSFSLVVNCSFTAIPRRRRRRRRTSSTNTHKFEVSFTSLSCICCVKSVASECCIYFYFYDSRQYLGQGYKAKKALPGGKITLDQIDSVS